METFAVETQNKTSIKQKMNKKIRYLTNNFKSLREQLFVKILTWHNY